MASLGITGCGHMRSHYSRPEASIPETFPHADASARASIDRWWLTFGDKSLDELVDRALTRNSDLAVAALRVRAAELESHLIVINPAVAASYAYDGARILGTKSPWIRAGVLRGAVSYEADLWDQLAATKDVAGWEARATEQDRQSTAFALIGTTVNLYYQIASLNEQLSLGKESIAYASKTLDLVKALAAAGAASRLEIAESEQNLESQQAALTELAQQLTESRNALAVLLDGDRWPETRELGEVPDQPPPPVDAGIPASLLNRRPDLRAAELRLREALASSDATRLAFYPQLTLTGSVSTVGTELSELLRNPAASLAAAVSAPFLQFDQAKFSTALARTQYKEASLTFRKTLLQAVYDVDNTLSARARLADESRWLERSLAAAKEVERLDGVRYRAGSIALQFWLNAQQLRKAAELALTANRLATLQNYSTLCQALGGDAHILER